MRCPNNCNEGKFVTLECGEPEEETPLDIGEDGAVTGSFKLTRNCGECGDALKEAVVDLDDTVDADEVKPHFGGGEHALSIELDSVEADESGGGRYRKNLISAVVEATVTCSCDKAFSHDVTLDTDGCAASAFEECF